MPEGEQRGGVAPVMEEAGREVKATLVFHGSGAY
jgi:hypothetical protein